MAEQAAREKASDSAVVSQPESPHQAAIAAPEPELPVTKKRTRKSTPKQEQADG